METLIPEASATKIRRLLVSCHNMSSPSIIPNNSEYVMRFISIPYFFFPFSLRLIVSFPPAMTANVLYFPLVPFYCRQTILFYHAKISRVTSFSVAPILRPVFVSPLVLSVGGEFGGARGGILLQLDRRRSCQKSAFQKRPCKYTPNRLLTSRRYSVSSVLPFTIAMKLG